MRSRTVYVALAASWLASGCHAVRYISPEAAVDGAQKGEVHKTFAHSLLFGAIPVGPVNLGEYCQDTGLYSLRSSTGPFGYLMGALTFGVWTPHRVKITCNAPGFDPIPGPVEEAITWEEVAPPMPIAPPVAVAPPPPAPTSDTAVSVQVTVQPPPPAPLAMPAAPPLPAAPVAPPLAEPVAAEPVEVEVLAVEAPPEPVAAQLAPVEEDAIVITASVPGPSLDRPSGTDVVVEDLAPAPEPELLAVVPSPTLATVGGDALAKVPTEGPVRLVDLRDPNALLHEAEIHVVEVPDGPTVVIVR